ncbi:hypothetical protein [Nocardia salmonicida]|uniref:hypothetical protein n=1 Tax=Nocardia salmonicida TaxID=53431 RepID=UPI0037A7D089
MTDPNHEVARKLLEQLGIQPQDLLPKSDPAPAPTFDEYIARIIPTVSAGTLRTYRPYWQRLQQEWGTRRLDDPTSPEMPALVERIRAGAVHRRNSRDGRSAAEHMVSALRYLYRFAASDGYVRTSNAATELTKPRRLPSPRGAIAAERLRDVIEAVTTTGDDTELDTLLLRLHLETACRTGSVGPSFHHVTGCQVCGDRGMSYRYTVSAVARSAITWSVLSRHRRASSSSVTRCTPTDVSSSSGA